MAYIGDLALGSTFDTKFTTVSTAGVPTTLAGTPVISAYVDNSTTEITAGITLSVDFDSRTGMHNIRVVATSGNGYAAGGNYQLVITTGTVGGSSVVGYVVAEFSIEARSALRPTTAGRTLDVSAGGEAGVDWANVGSPTTTLNLSGTTVKTATDVETDTQDIQARLPAALVSGRIDASVGAMAANVLTATAINADAITAAKIADGAIDAATFATGAITADAIAADAIGSSELAASAVTEIQSGLSTLDAAGVRSAVGLASANLDTQLSTIDDFLDTEVAAIKAKTDSLTFTVAGQVDANAQYINDTQLQGDGSATPWGPV